MDHPSFQTYLNGLEASSKKKYATWIQDFLNFESAIENPTSTSNSVEAYLVSLQFELVIMIPCISTALASSSSGRVEL
jgi:hypothetical protein